jgi:beta-glucanase (GH16 family)
MRKLILIFCLFAWSIDSVGQQAPSNCAVANVILNNVNGCPISNLALAFEDNFDGNKLDFNKWNAPYQCVLNDFSFSNSKHWYANYRDTAMLGIPLSNNIEVSGGTLKLKAKREIPAIVGGFVTDWSTNPPNMVFSYFDYSSAQIISKNIFHYGRYEIRCKIPKGKGFWPAFWMFGRNTPYWNEIDVFEFWNERTALGVYDPNKLAKDPNTTMHYDYGSLGGGNHQSCLQDGFGTTDYSQNFHVFAVDWSEFYMIWSIDGVIVRTEGKYWNTNNSIASCGTIVNGQTYQRNKAFPDAPMEIYASFQIQNNNGNNPDASTPFPSTFEIDYIRYYKYSDCYNSSNYFSNINQLSPIFNQSQVQGANLKFGTNFTIPSGKTLAFKGRDEVKFDDGFTSVAGSDLVASIDNTICSGVLKSTDYQNTIQEIEIDTASQKTLEALTTINPYFQNGSLKIDIISALVEHYELRLVDCMGKTVFYQTNIDKTKQNTFPISSLAKGVYILKIKDTFNSFSFNQKMIYLE